MSSWNAVKTELREVVWLASIVGGLSVLGVGAAVALAMAFDIWSPVVHV